MQATTPELYAPLYAKHAFAEECGALLNDLAAAHASATQVPGLECECIELRRFTPKVRA